MSVVLTGEPAIAAPPPRSPRHRVSVGVLAVSTGAAVLLPDGAWVLVAVVGQLAAAALDGRGLDSVARCIAALAVLLAVPPVLLLGAAADPGAVARLAAVACALWVVLARRWSPSPPSPRVHSGWAAVTLGGLGVLASSYLLWGPSGPISLLERDHVRHAAALGSALGSGPDVAVWAEGLAAGIREQSGALPATYAVWIGRATTGTAPSGADLIVLTLVASLLTLAIAWVAVAVASGVATDSLASAGRFTWMGLGLFAVLIGPLLWLRVHGRWPEALAMGALVLAATTIGVARNHTPPVQRGTHAPGRLLALPLLTLACLAWPPMVLPVAAGLVVRLFVVRPACPDRAAVAFVHLLPVGLGVAWAARTWPGLTGPGPSELAGPDWRLLALTAVLAGLMVRHGGRPEPMSGAVGAVLILCGLTCACGLLSDYLASAVASWNTDLTDTLGILGLMAGVPTIAAWLASGDNRHDPWRLWSWRSTALIATVSCLAVWIPWGSQQWPGRTLVLAAAIPEWSRTAVDGQSTVGQQALRVQPMLRCGWDAIIVWPPESPRIGAIAASSMWSAVLAGRTDEVGWGAIDYVYPQYDPPVTLEDQFNWLRVVGAGHEERRILWILPDDIALSAAARVPSEGVPAGVELRVVGDRRSREELAECVAMEGGA